MNKPDVNLLNVLLWKDGTRKGMGADLFFFALIMFVVSTLLAAFGHALPKEQAVTVEVLQALIAGAGAMVAYGAHHDKKHEETMKKLENEAANAPAQPAS